MNRAEGVASLDFIVHNLSKKLSEYSKSPNSKKWVIDDKTYLINQLIEIRDSIKPLVLEDIWYKLEQSLLDVEKHDPQISLHMIRLRRSFNSDSMAYYEFDYNN